MGQWADGTLADPVDHLGDGGIVGELVVHEEAEVFLRRLLPEFADEEGAGHIYGDRLGDVDVASRIHGVLGLPGIETRHVEHDQRFYAALDGLFVCRQSREAAGFVHAQFFSECFRHLGEIIRHGVDVVAAVLLDDPAEKSRAMAAADDADLDLAGDIWCGGWGWYGVRGRGRVGGCGERFRSPARECSEYRSDGRHFQRAADEIPAIHAGGLIWIGGHRDYFSVAWDRWNTSWTVPGLLARQRQLCVFAAHGSAGLSIARRAPKTFIIFQ